MCRDSGHRSDLEIDVVKDSFERIHVRHIRIDDDEVVRGLSAGVCVDNRVDEIGTGNLRAAGANALDQADVGGAAALIVVGSLAVLFVVLVLPPPETVAELVTLAGAVSDTLTVTVMTG